ncbi:MAG: hypothetical protein AB1529_07555 [Candidatus Micrarchaeota archaeon]
MGRIAILAIALAVMAGCTQQEGVPKSVLDRYDSLSAEYSSGLGATLSGCTEGGQGRYVVVGSGGFSGVTYIYDGAGTLISQYSWDDMVEPGETPPPYDADKYECTLMRQSKT